MRRWLIKHEQKELPFVISEGRISSGLFPQNDGIASFAVAPSAARSPGNHVTLGEKTYRVALAQKGTQIMLNIDGMFYRLQATQLRSESAAGSSALEIRSEIPGRIIKVLVLPGDEVKPGQAVIVQEAMKMEITLVAGAARRIAEVYVEPGAQVTADAVLIRFTDDNEK